MRFAFIQAHAETYHVVTMCRVLEVSKTGFYAWRQRQPSARAQADRQVEARLRAIHARVRGRYGSPRMQAELRAEGITCGKHRVARLMRRAGLCAKPAVRYRVTTHSDPRAAFGANHLARAFAPTTGPQVVWMADITYIPTNEGWLYLAVVLERDARRVVGWAVQPRLDQGLTLSALRMALTTTGARGGLHHADRGTQYTSFAYTRALAAAGFTASWSRVGNCWDNAVAESFFATVTKELLDVERFPTREAARTSIFAFIEIWYNRQRRHSSLGYRTPREQADLLQATN